MFGAEAREGVAGKFLGSGERAVFGAGGVEDRVEAGAQAGFGAGEEGGGRGGRMAELAGGVVERLAENLDVVQHHGFVDGELGDEGREAGGEGRMMMGVGDGDDGLPGAIAGVGRDAAADVFDDGVPQGLLPAGDEGGVGREGLGPADGAGEVPGEDGAGVGLAGKTGGEKGLESLAGGLRGEAGMAGTVGHGSRGEGGRRR